MFSRRGFTLIELLVVIAIIGILATIITANLTTGKKKSNDARRVSDIKTIQSALEQYFNDNYFYPKNIYAVYNSSDGVSPSDGLAPAYLPAMPVDPSYNIAPSTCAGSPSTAGCYTYKAYGTTGACTAPTMYHLGVPLETSNNSALNQDADACLSGSTLYLGCTGSSGVGSGVSTGLVGCTAQGAADFDGRSAAAGTSICNNTTGSPQPGGTETCYDWTP